MKILIHNSNTVTVKQVPKNKVISSISNIIDDFLDQGFECYQNLLNTTKSFVDKQKLGIYLKEFDFLLEEKNYIYLEKNNKYYIKIFLK